MTAAIRRFLPLIVIALFVAALWLPFGVKTTGLMEEWLSYNSYERVTPTDRDEPVNFLTLSGEHRLRPLQDTTTAFAHLLTPDSFVGLNIVHMVSIILKGIAFYLVLTQLMPGQRLFALTGALLLVVFPADEGIFTFRGVHIHGAVACYLFGVYFLLRAWDTHRIRYVFAMIAFTVISIFIYEVGYPLVVCTPLILLLKHGAPDFRKWLLRLGLAWYVALLITLLYTALTLTSGATYQTWVVQHSGVSEGSLVQAMAQAVWNAYVQHFIGGWLDSARLLFANAAYTLLAALMTLVALGVGWRLFADDAPASRRRILWRLVFGLAAIFLGYSLFLLTPYRELKWRVFLYSSMGGALCFVCLCALLGGRSRLRYAILSGALLFAATVGALHQQAHYVLLSQTQQRLLQGVIAAVPQPNPAVPVVVVDETGDYRDNWTLGASYLVTSSLQYLYQNYDLQFILCSHEGNGQFRSLPELREQCHFDASGLTVDHDGQQVWSFPYSGIVLVRHTASATTVLTSIPPEYLPANTAAVGYDPQPLLKPDASLPRRYGTLFSIPAR